MTKDIELHERVAGLETEVKEIKTNHLPHIQASVDRVDERLWWILGSVIALGVVGIAVSFIK